MSDMSSFAQSAEVSFTPKLSPGAHDHLHQLLADWQVLADLAAADLVLWLHTDDDRFFAAENCRPSTSITVHADDPRGLYLPLAREAELREAIRTGKVVRPTSPHWAGTYSVLEVCVPILYEGEVIAVLTRETNLSSPRLAQNFDTWTSDAADIICEMITQGEYPYKSAPTASAHGVPRVQDGAILIDQDGKVLQTTPNAMSCLRRIGIRQDSVFGEVLAERITDAVSDENSVEESLAVVVMGRAPWRVELSVQGVTISLRALPLVDGHKRLGAVILTRDITEIRRREQELMTKDATIREIHHRVKNNLQTVSALLRLQSRRSDLESVQAALKEAERRVQAIATVHEALSQDVNEQVDFDDVARTIVRMAGTLASTDHAVDVTTSGEFGSLAAAQAQAMATVLNELVSNSVEHGLADKDGLIHVHAQRNGDQLIVTVTDNGAGIQPGRAMTGLGTQIVNQMVRGELRGSIDWEPAEGGGTVVTLKARLSD